MKKINFFSFLFSIFPTLFLFAGRSFAADAYLLEMPLQGEDVSISGPAEYVKMIFLFGLGIVGVVALFSIVWGGIRYLTSGGSETGKTEGKRWIIGALSGVVLLFSSYLILNTINPELVSLKNPSLDAITIEDLPENPRALSPYTPGGTPLPSSPIPGGQLPANLAALKANELSQILSYQYGGDPSTGRTDCSGAAERLRIEVGGHDPGRSTQAMLNEAHASGNFSMDPNNLQPGDIIIRTAKVESGMHAGTYIGNGLVWNSIPNKGFSIETLNSYMTRANGTLLGINKFH